MKKTLIALAVLGAAAGFAHAQSNVTIYGIVDTGFVKEEGNRLAMDEKVNNRLGFRGTEDLGGGLKATFELEQRFDLFDGGDRGRTAADSRSGTDRSGPMFDGAANVGLAGGFGAVRFGRLNELSTETLRTLDPFNQYGVAGMLETPLRGDDTNGRLSNSARYDSPNFGGFSVGASYTLQVNDALADVGNDGYALSAKYMNGPIVVLGNYNRAVNSNDSYNWNVGGAYSMGPLKLSLAYEKTKLKAGVQPDDVDGGILADDVDLKNILVGATYNIGKGAINASFNRLKADGDAFDGTTKKFALGYTHNLSKRTSVYLDLAQTKYDDDAWGYSAGDDDKVNAVQLGVTHKF